MGFFDFLFKGRKIRVQMEGELPPHILGEDETLGQFHQRIYAQFTDDLKAPAVAMLRKELPEVTKAQIRAAIAADPDGWVAPYHFYWGMSIRNLLRERGFGEAYWPIWNLDDIYVSLVEDAVK